MESTIRYENGKAWLAGAVCDGHHCERREGKGGILEQQQTFNKPGTTYLGVPLKAQREQK